MKSAHASIVRDLLHLKNRKKSLVLRRFFKTGVGEYGYGDIFLGVTVPQQRAIVKRYFMITSLFDIKKLLYSPIHEHRLTALLLLVQKFQKAELSDKKNIFDFYLTHLHRVNNWDLVDSSADKIVGAYLFFAQKDFLLLEKMAQSNDLWTRRVAIIATFYFIKNNEFKLTLRISEILLGDDHDLIHKAVGWMLREVGKKSLPTEESFLQKHYKTMPRTMLRYAIERFPTNKRTLYLQKHT